MQSLPSKDDILAFLRDNPTQTSKRDVARAFGLKGAAKIELKRLLRDMADEGLIEKRKRRFREPGSLPPVTVLRMEAGPDGDLYGIPAEWDQSDPAPRVLYMPGRKDPALAPGDRVLARLTKVPGEVPYEGRLIRRIGTGPRRMLGIYRVGSESGRLVPVDKRNDRESIVPSGETGGAKDGELVEAETIGRAPRMGLARVRVVERLGDPGAPKAISLIAIHEHGIPDHFPDAAVVEAETAQPVALGDRLDLRHLPLFTIDPTDARDHDDAICAIPDEDPKNAGGYVVWVAIADVAHYVRPGSALDDEARKRGNSTYFPDRVVPMLPDALSGDLCSLHEGADRPCIAVCARLSPIGEKIEHSFHRAMMRSPASLNYGQAQVAAEGQLDAVTEPLAQAIADLFGAYACAVKARDARQPLNLDLPERQIVLSEEGRVTSVAFKDRLDAHRLVEEFMVMANVCAAETLEAHRTRLLYRVHEEPSPEKLDALRDVAEAAGLKFARGQVLRTVQLNKLLDAAAGTEDSEVVSMTVLRSMTQAYYGPENMGHFGLNLKRYAHFTSPIRRYADLVVHRALVAAHGWGDDGQAVSDLDALRATGDWVSQTERRSMLAERDTADRYLAAFLSERVGDEFAGRVSGIAKFGLFVKLDDSGADGMVPLSTLGREYWVYNRDANSLTGDQSGRVIRVGDMATVRLAEAAPVTGGLLLEVLDIAGKPLPQSSGGRRARGPGKAGPKNLARKRQVTRGGGGRRSK
ncbi:MAG: ribonuclease R [Pseudomonadota bacterium]